MVQNMNRGKTIIAETGFAKYRGLGRHGLLTSHPHRNIIMLDGEEFRTGGSSWHDLLTAENGIAALDFANRIIKNHLRITEYNGLSGSMVFLKLASGTVVREIETIVERIYRIYPAPRNICVIKREEKETDNRVKINIWQEKLLLYRQEKGKEWRRLSDKALKYQDIVSRFAIQYQKQRNRAGFHIVGTSLYNYIRLNKWQEKLLLEQLLEKSIKEDNFVLNQMGVFNIPALPQREKALSIYEGIKKHNYFRMNIRHKNYLFFEGNTKVFNEKEEMFLLQMKEKGKEWGRQSDKILKYQDIVSRFAIQYQKQRNRAGFHIVGTSLYNYIRLNKWQEKLLLEQLLEKNIKKDSPVLSQMGVFNISALFQSEITQSLYQKLKKYDRLQIQISQRSDLFFAGNTKVFNEKEEKLFSYMMEKGKEWERRSDRISRYQDIVSKFAIQYQKQRNDIAFYVTRLRADNYIKINKWQEKLLLEQLSERNIEEDNSVLNQMDVFNISVLHQREIARSIYEGLKRHDHFQMHIRKRSYLFFEGIEEVFNEKGELLLRYRQKKGKEWGRRSDKISKYQDIVSKFVTWYQKQRNRAAFYVIRWRADNYIKINKWQEKLLLKQLSEKNIKEDNSVLNQMDVFNISTLHQREMAQSIYEGLKRHDHLRMQIRKRSDPFFAGNTNVFNEKREMIFQDILEKGWERQSDTISRKDGIVRKFAIQHQEQKENVYVWKNNTRLVSEIRKYRQSTEETLAKDLAEQQEGNTENKRMIEMLEKKIQQQEERIKELEIVQQRFQDWGNGRKDDQVDEEKYFEIFNNDLVLEQMRYGIM